MTSSLSHATTEPSLGIIDRHAANVSEWPNLPKHVASSSAIPGQSASSAERTFTDVEVS